MGLIARPAARQAASFVVAAIVASFAATAVGAQEAVSEQACARLLPAIERLEAVLRAEAARGSAGVELQRMQIVTTLLELRYRSLDSLESSLRESESEEGDVRAAVARTQVQLDSIEEAARTSGAATPDPELKARRADYDAVMKGLEERAKALRESRSSYQGQIAIERAEIQKLEGLVKSWLEKVP